MIKRADWLAITKDRAAVLLLVLIVLGVIAIILTTVLRIQPSDIQVPVRFTGYGQSNIDRDLWYTQIGYTGFGVLLAVINGFLAIKIHATNRMLGLGLMGMTIFLLVLALIISNAVFNLAPSV